jgi:hypothetical protein
MAQDLSAQGLPTLYTTGRRVETQKASCFLPTQLSARACSRAVGRWSALARLSAACVESHKRPCIEIILTLAVKGLCVKKIWASAKPL